MATRNCADTSYEEVNNAVNGVTSVGHTTWSSPAANGDIVNIPAGTSTWATTLQVSANITLQGATTVVESIPGDPRTIIVTDNTIIQDGTTGSANPGGNVIYCNFNGSNPSDPVIKGITFDNTTRTAVGGIVFYLKGNHHRVRITQCNFKASVRYIFWVTGETFGVMDHCSSTQTSGSEKISTNQDTYDGGTNGDGSFNDGPNVLLANSRRSWAWYFEDCQFISVTGKHGAHDGQSGGRRVIRSCYFLNVPLALHGTESGGRHRGMRLCENYNNYITYNTAGGITGTQWRAGSGYVWGNTYTAWASYKGFQLVNFREDAYSVNYAWGAANGANSLDKNDSDGSGNYTPPSLGGSPHLFYSGTITSSVTTPSPYAGINIPVTVTISDLPAMDWTGFSISDTSSGTIDTVNPVNNTASVALIESNAGTTLTTEMTANQNSPPCTWAPGDSVVIYRIARTALDQPGSGKVNNLTGNPPTNTDWPLQNTEPVYAWMNTNNGPAYTTLLDLPTTPKYPTIKANRDFFNAVGGIQTSPTSPFNGTVGTGYGTIANRPTTCTPGWDKVSGDGPVAQPQGDGNAPGVAYWATDEQKLYVATGVNTWTLYYQPYNYPHPITGTAVGPIINIPSSHDFGNIVVLESGTFDIPVTNTGDSTLTVDSITYPTGYSGPTTSFTVGVGVTVLKTATFTPTSATTFSGNIIFDSNASSGNESMAVTGVGVPGAGGGGKSKKKRKNVLISRF